MASQLIWDVLTHVGQNVGHLLPWWFMFLLNYDLLQVCCNYNHFEVKHGKKKNPGPRSILCSYGPEPLFDHSLREPKWHERQWTSAGMRG